MSMPQRSNWLQIAGLPGRERFYTGSFDVHFHTYDFVYCAIQGINKAAKFGKDERHEMLFLVAHQGRIELIDRFVQRTDFEGHLGRISIKLHPDGSELYCSVIMDFDKTSASMFPVYSFTLPTAQRRDIKTYKV